jgi:hypothetical protein
VSTDLKKLSVIIVCYVGVIAGSMYVIWGVLVPLLVAVLAPEIAHQHLCTFYSEGYLGRSC